MKNGSGQEAENEGLVREDVLRQAVDYDVKIHLGQAEARIVVLRRRTEERSVLKRDEQLNVRNP